VAAHRCADQRFPRSARTVRGEVRRSDPEQLRRGRGYRHLGLLGAWLLWRDVQVKMIQSPP
jgi:hypothetical protein